MAVGETKSNWGGRREPGIDPTTGQKKKLGRPPGSGKGKRTKPEPIQMPAGDDGFFDRVFARIGEPLPDKVTSPEDYALDLLFARDYQVRSVTWNRMLDHKYGRPSVKRGVARGAESSSDAKTVLFASASTCRSGAAKSSKSCNVVSETTPAPKFSPNPDGFTPASDAQKHWLQSPAGLVPDAHGCP